jgi:hypothetical protein
METPFYHIAIEKPMTLNGDWIDAYYNNNNNYYQLIISEVWNAFLHGRPSVRHTASR